MGSGNDDALIQRLRRAQEIVSLSEVDSDLRSAAFTEAFRALGEASVGLRAAESKPEQNDGPLSPDLSDRLASVADAFGVDGAVVEQVFADDEDDLRIVIPPRRLEGSARGAMKQIAILLVCARQAGGWDASWTQAQSIRDECMRIGVYSKHFSEVLGGLDMFSAQGSGVQRRLRAHTKSFAAARDVLQKMGVLSGGADD